MATSPRAAMLALEASQLLQQEAVAGEPNRFEEILPDPDLPASAISPQLDAAAASRPCCDHPRASKALKRHLRGDLSGRLRWGRSHLPPKTGRRRRRGRGGRAGAAQAAAAAASARPRRLRRRAGLPAVCGATPSIPASRSDCDTAPVEPGHLPRAVGTARSPARSASTWRWSTSTRRASCFYEPVDLDDPELLAQDGLPPSEGSPQFHQQMVYAVGDATIGQLRARSGPQGACGRRGRRRRERRRRTTPTSCRRLRIYPHALREANAYYSPAKKALLFGYFPASADDPGEHLPGGMVFTCLSHDIVAHETTHALLDGMHRALHRADQPGRAGLPRGLRRHRRALPALHAARGAAPPDRRRPAATCVRTRNLLGELARQFGQATGKRGALRSAIGELRPAEDRGSRANPIPATTSAPPSRTGAAPSWSPRCSTPSSRSTSADPPTCCASPPAAPACCRGRRSRPTWSSACAEAATKAGQHVLRMCIRALDYCPPVDLTFGEYLRAHHHRRLRPRARRRPRLPRRLRRGLPAARHLPARRCARCRWRACAGAARATTTPPPRRSC